MIRFLIILLCSPSIIFGQTETQLRTAEKIKEYYSKSISNQDSLKCQKLFFEYFPDKFDDFNAIFGWVGNNGIQEAHGGPLYDGHNEILFFFQLKVIPEKEFYNKILNISIGGHWDADAINYFQDGLREKVFANPKLTFDLLQGKSDLEIQSFFFFFYQSIHPVYIKIPNEFTGMKTYDIRLYRLMEKGLNEALKKSGHD